MGDRRGESSRSGSRIMGRGESVVIDHGGRRSSCGYCRSPARTSISHGLWAQSLTVDDYQELLDRGWRRSGSFLYKPEMERTCCPSYTIRLNVHDFKPSKEQVRVLKKMQRFLDGKNHLEDNKNSSKCFSNHDIQSSSGEVSKSLTRMSENIHDEEDRCVHYLSCRIDDAIVACVENGEFPSTVQLPKAIVKKVKPQAKRKLMEVEDLLYTSSISFQVAAVRRRSQTLLTENENQGGEKLELSPNIVAEKLACSMDRLGLISGISVKACNGHLNFYSSVGSCKESVTADRLKHRSKDNRGGAEDCRMPDGSSSLPCKRRRLEIRTKRSSFDPEEYALYRRYQMRVHNDEEEKVTEESYRRFLVDTPLIFCPLQSDKEAPSCGFGSFHQQYLIDGKIVAVGVVDILPKCLSSKYLFWDPDFAFLSLGKYSALKEIDWVKENHVHCHSLQYYYLGYYIHSCSKMRYKAAYYPSELLCPLRYRWVPFHVVRPLLDEKPYVVLSDAVTMQSEMSSPQLLHLNSSREQRDNPEEILPSNSRSDDNEEADLDLEGESDFDEESNLSVLGELWADNVKNIMIDLNGIRVRFKDLQQVIGPVKRKNLEMLELQLHRYVKVVGSTLAGRMIYSLG